MIRRRPRDAWRDQRGSGHEGTETRTDASGPDMWPDDQPTSAGPSDALRADDRKRRER